MPIIRDAVLSSTNKYGYGCFRVDPIGFDHAKAFNGPKIQVASDKDGRQQSLFGIPNTDGPSLFELDSKVFDADDVMSELSLLKRINKEQRYNYRKNGVIPQPVLEMIWKWGIKYTDSVPERGSRVEYFLEKLDTYIKSQSRLFNRTSDKSKRKTIALRADAAWTLYQDTLQWEHGMHARPRK